MRREIIVSLVLLASVVALYLSLDLMDDPRSIIFPRVIIIIIGVLSFFLLIQALMMGEKLKEKTSASFYFGPFFVCFCLIVIYFFVMEKLGFYVSAFLFYVTVTFVLGWKDITPKKGAVRVLSAAIFTGVLYFLFQELLSVQTPKGILF